MKTKAIIFDLDGTLMDSMHLWLSPDFNGDLEQTYKNEVVLKPGAFDFLKTLERDGVRMVLATATDRNMVIPAIKRNKIDGFFEKIFTCGEVGSSKRAPVIYFKALEYLGLSQEDVWAFEDAFYAAETAANAGFKVAVVYDQWAGLLTLGRRVKREEFMKFSNVYIEDYRGLDLGFLN